MAQIWFYNNNNIKFLCVQQKSINYLYNKIYFKTIYMYKLFADDAQIRRRW